MIPEKSALSVGKIFCSPQIGKGQNFLECPQKGKMKHDGEAEGPR